MYSTRRQKFFNLVYFWDPAQPEMNHKHPESVDTLNPAFSITAPMNNGEVLHRDENNDLYLVDDV
jgi:hypothetical protein